MTTDVVGLSCATCGSPRSAARRPHARRPMRQVSWHTRCEARTASSWPDSHRPLGHPYRADRRERRFVGRCGRHDEGMRGSGCCSGWASSLSGCTAVSTWRNTSHSVLVHSAHEAEAAAPQSSETRDGAPILVGVGLQDSAMRAAARGRAPSQCFRQFSFVEPPRTLFILPSITAPSRFLQDVRRFRA